MQSLRRGVRCISDRAVPLLAIERLEKSVKRGQIADKQAREYYAGNTRD